MNFKNIFYILSLITFITSCEDVIDVDLADGDQQLVIDAWINNLPQAQTIKLSRTISYFDNSQPPAETGAAVIITDSNGVIYNFEDVNNDGNYTWTPSTGTSFGAVNDGYLLSITTASGIEYNAVSSMNRIMPIDSITLEDREEELGEVAGIYAEVFAVDFIGEGDAYWIKTFKNGSFLNKPLEMNLVFDAAFTPNSGVDGVNFILPIRQNINRIADEGDDAIDTDELAPWVEGDFINIEIHSLNIDAFLFLEQAFTQMTLGDAGIFAEPPTNVPSNIEVLNSTEAKDKPIGFFNISAVSTLGREIEL